MIRVNLKAADSDRRGPDPDRHSDRNLKAADSDRRGPDPDRHSDRNLKAADSDRRGPDPDRHSDRTLGPDSDRTPMTLPGDSNDPSRSGWTGLGPGLGPGLGSGLGPAWSALGPDSDDPTRTGRRGRTSRPGPARATFGVEAEPELLGPSDLDRSFNGPGGAGPGTDRVHAGYSSDLARSLNGAFPFSVF